MCVSIAPAMQGLLVLGFECGPYLLNFIFIMFACDSSSIM